MDDMKNLLPEVAEEKAEDVLMLVKNEEKIQIINKISKVDLSKVTKIDEIKIILDDILKLIAR